MGPHTVCTSPKSPNIRRRSKGNSLSRAHFQTQRRVDSAEQFELEDVIIATVDLMVILEFENCIESVYETAIGTLRAGYLEYYAVYYIKYK